MMIVQTIWNYLFLFSCANKSWLNSFSGFLDAIASLEVAYVRVSVRCHQFWDNLSKFDQFWRFQTDEQQTTNRLQKDYQQTTNRWPTEDDQQKMTYKRWPAKNDLQKMTYRRWPTEDDLQEMTYKRWPTKDDLQKMTYKRWPTEDDLQKMAYRWPLDDKQKTIKIPTLTTSPCWPYRIYRLLVLLTREKIWC